MTKLFSIKQEFSEKIFSKKKLVEFRRQNVNVTRNETCLVYTSGKVRKITGYFIVKEKIRLPLKKLWVETKKYAGITREQFNEYFKGCKEGTAILLEKIIKFVRAISLEQIRNEIKTFHPPQSYYNLKDNLRTIIVDLLPKKSSRHFL